MKPRKEKHYTTARNALRYNLNNVIYYRNNPYTGAGYLNNSIVRQYYEMPCTLYLVKYGYGYIAYKLVINK